jgi:hypothetical protein
MTAYYDMGYCEAENKEEAERITRAKASAFSDSEKRLITGRKTTVAEMCREKAEKGGR